MRKLLIVFTIIVAASTPTSVALAQTGAARFVLTMAGVPIAAFSRFESLVDPAATGGTQAVALAGGYALLPSAGGLARARHPR